MYKKKLVRMGCVAVLSVVCLSSPHAAQKTPNGLLETAAGAYTFTPTVCGMFIEEGEYDVEVYGPGSTPDGDKMHFEFSSTGQALSVSIGVDEMYASSDKRILSMDGFEMQVDGSKIRVEALKLVDENLQLIDSTARLDIDCSRA